MKKLLVFALLCGLLLCSGCGRTAAQSDVQNAAPAEQAAFSERLPAASASAVRTSFLPGMGCDDEHCTDPSHHHDCPEDCTDYEHHHHCPLDCTEESHHHTNHHAEGHHSSHHG